MKLETYWFHHHLAPPPQPQPAASVTHLAQLLKKPLTLHSASFTATAAINDGENMTSVTPSGLVAEMTVSAHAHQENIKGSVILNGQ